VRGGAPVHAVYAADDPANAWHAGASTELHPASYSHSTTTATDLDPYFAAHSYADVHTDSATDWHSDDLARMARHPLHWRGLRDYGGNALWGNKELGTHGLERN